jgi:hypothetical protein
MSKNATLKRLGLRISGNSVILLGNTKEKDWAQILLHSKLAT